MSLPAMTNLNADTEPGGLLSAEDFEQKLRAPWTLPRVIPTQRPWWLRAWRWATLPMRHWYVEWRMRSIVDEREGYAKVAKANGGTLGEKYLKNCDKQLKDLRNKQAWLDLDY